jgi:hypothetical protein
MWAIAKAFILLCPPQACAEGAFLLYKKLLSYKAKK